MTPAIVLAILVGILVLAFLASNIVVKKFRMPEHGWRAAIIVFFTGVGILIVTTSWPPKQGIDLKGGVILVYEIDEEKTKLNKQTEEDAIEQSNKSIQDGLVKAISQRINPGGVQETIVRPYGDKQVEIVIPDVSPQEVDLIKATIVKGGFLKFMIVANQRNHSHIWNLADDPRNVGRNLVTDANGKTVAQWVDVAYDESENGEITYKVDTLNAKTREVAGIKQVLMYFDVVNQMEGQHLSAVRMEYKDLSPVVAFNMTPLGARYMGAITAANKPDQSTGFKSRLGIVLDNSLISAPNINSTITGSGIIEGRFTDQEVQVLVDVLRAGRLPAILEETPIRESFVSPLLGKDTIRSGRIAITSSLIVVLVFMVAYYRFAGIVSCVALLLNLVMIFAMMIFIGAAFSLAGLAGLVLTVGMSVDANVLIFERIKEELRNGAALRMAIRNGFSRATPTIIDANATNLITALVLYGMGGDQLQGYAVPLILGILMCMFTAIFVSRLIFEIAERQRWIKSLSMTQLLSSPEFNLFGLRSMAAVASVIVIVIGLSSGIVRGRNLFDIDFNGGNSVTFKLNESTPIEDVREKVEDIADDVSVTGHQQPGIENQIYQVDTSKLKDVDDQEDQLRKIKESITQRFTSNGQLSLETHKINFTTPTLVVNDKASDASNGTQPDANASSSMSRTGTQDLLALSAPLTGILQAESPTENTEGNEDPVESETPAKSSEDNGQDVEEEAGKAENDSEPESKSDPTSVTDAEESEPQTTPSEDALTPTEDKTTKPEETTAAENTSTPQDNEAEITEAELTGDAIEDEVTEDETETTPAIVQSGTTISFKDGNGIEEPINAATVLDELQKAAKELHLSEPNFDLNAEGWNKRSSIGFPEWDVTATVPPEQLQQILDKMKNRMEATPIWLSANEVGSKVAGDTRGSAIAAIVVALLGIVAYIWLRFQRVVFGLAAVIALIHDVLVTVGAIGVSYWIVKSIPFLADALYISEFKISLPVVAAILTIIGYSLNDTIVVFDRIREVKGKSPRIDAEMINTSINQTLSRTILTSLTTLIAVTILYIWGGQGIHPFSFALLIGIVVGTYSSIFVASPALLWLSNLTADTPAKKEKVTA